MPTSGARWSGPSPWSTACCSWWTPARAPPQTRFVLRKSLESHLPVLVVINKVDRTDARPAEVLDAVYDLFIDLGAVDHQIEFPVVYCNARTGQAALSPEEVPDAPGLKVLFELLVEYIPAPEYTEGHPFQALVCNLDASPYVGRLAICRVHQGWVHKGDTVAWCRSGPGGEVQRVRINELYLTEALQRVDAGPGGPAQATSWPWPGSPRS